MTITPPIPRPGSRLDRLAISGGILGLLLLAVLYAVVIYVGLTLFWGSLVYLVGILLSEVFGGAPISIGLSLLVGFIAAVLFGTGKGIGT